MRILITGGGGQLASELCRTMCDDELIPLRRSDLDITDVSTLHSALDHYQPDAVINTAAFHDVDVCESEPESAFSVNAAAVRRIAAFCASRCTLVHISTDYVFDGRSRTPYPESAALNPLSVYGASKAAGEMVVRAVGERNIIVRTTGLYSMAGQSTRHGNFVETMLRLGRQGKGVTVVADQVMTPSYAPDVASVIRALLHGEATGTFHVTNAGQCSWYEFAKEIFRLAGLDVDLSPTTQAERRSPARRPAYSVLAHGGIRRVGIPELRQWREALAAFMQTRLSDAE